MTKKETTEFLNNTGVISMPDEIAWETFFKEIGANVKRNFKTFKVGSGKELCPTFIINNVKCITYDRIFTLPDLWVFVEPDVSRIDGYAISLFSGFNDFVFNIDEEASDERPVYFDCPSLVLTKIPEGKEMSDIDYAIWKVNRDRSIVQTVWPAFPFNFIQINGTSWVVHPCVTKDGEFALFGSFFDQLWKLNNLAQRDDAKTFEAFEKANHAFLKAIGRDSN